MRSRSRDIVSIVLGWDLCWATWDDGTTSFSTRSSISPITQIWFCTHKTWFQTLRNAFMKQQRQSNAELHLRESGIVRYCLLDDSFLILLCTSCVGIWQPIESVTGDVYSSFLYSIVKQCKAGLNPNVKFEEVVILTPKTRVEQQINLKLNIWTWMPAWMAQLFRIRGVTPIKK